MIRMVMIPNLNCRETKINYPMAIWINFLRSFTSINRKKIGNKEIPLYHHDHQATM